MNYKDYYSKTGIPKQVSQEGNKACFKKTLQIQSTYIMRILYEISSFPKADDSFNINTSNIRFYDDGFSTNLSKKPDP